MHCIYYIHTIAVHRLSSQFASMGTPTQPSSGGRHSQKSALQLNTDFKIQVTCLQLNDDFGIDLNLTLTSYTYIY